MSSTQVGDAKAPATSGSTGVPFRLEVVVIPIADFDRAKDFYVGLGWRVDAEANVDNGYRLMQLTPPGSNASVIFGTQVTAAQPGSAGGGRHRQRPQRADFARCEGE